MDGIGRATGIAVATALAPWLTTCGEGGPTGPSDVEAVRIAGIAEATPAGVVRGPRPLRGSLNGIAEAGDPCSVDPPGITITATGEGVISHLGTTTLVQTACVSVAEFLPLGPSVATLTAANGDRLDGLVTGLTFGATGFVMEITVSGGTGRFTQAEGEYDVDVVQSAPLQPFVATLSGWLAY